MVVKVRLFASLRERADTDQIELELPEGARVSDALHRLADVTDGVPVVLAVNQEYAPSDQLLRSGDEVALVPPVSGGAAGPIAPPFHSRVTCEPLALDHLVARVGDPRAGAVVTFTGVTREVPELDYEAYAAMAERKLDEIVRAAVARHDLCGAAAEHRIGRVPLGEASVAVAVSAPHREAAFAGAREIIDELKAQAPIWKKERGEWVRGTTPR